MAGDVTHDVAFEGFSEVEYCATFILHNNEQECKLQHVCRT